MCISNFGLFLAGNVLQLDGTFLFIFISIFVLIFILNRTLFRPINNILDERERLGAGRLTEAKELLSQYEERLRHYEEDLNAARADAYRNLEQHRREFLNARQEMIAGVKSETSKQIAQAKEDITKQTDSAKQDLEKESRAMAAIITSQILHRPVRSEGS